MIAVRDRPAPAPVPAPGPEYARKWRPGIALVWRCCGCPRVLGFVDGDTLHVAHMGRTIEVRGDAFLQHCDNCGALNVWEPGGAVLSAS